MAYTQPTVADFKAYYDRDFPFGTTLAEVRDADITKALALAAINFNTAFFADQATYSIGFLYLTAHYLVTNLRNSSQGIAGQYSWLQTGKSVGNVSENFQIPQRILDNPEFAMYSKTTYGAEYLMLILPQLAGNMFVVCGGTRP